MMPVQTLAGKQVVIGVTGSIAAVETVRLIHELRRRGAEVRAVMSRAAAGIISPESLTYACGKPAITQISGLVEHVLYCGDGGSADLLLIAPCTANTISKMACGIDDTPVTTFATTALGRGMPVLVVPAMHHSMYRHPAITGNLDRLRSWGVRVIDPRIEEERAKIADTETIVLWCERMILGEPLRGERVLITSGPCREPVDDVRVLTTRSTGLMGRALALEAFRLGADVTVVHRDTFPAVTHVPADSAEEMWQAVHRCLDAAPGSFYISAAAVSDFAPLRYPGKIPSGKKTSIQLEPLPKLLDDVIGKFHPFTIAFKLGRDQKQQARLMLGKGISAVLTNDPETMGSPTGEYMLVSNRGDLNLTGPKEHIAREIWQALIALRSGNQAEKTK